MPPETAVPPPAAELPTGPARRRVFEVLAVCTANLCRSPIMEAQLRADLAVLPGAWQVCSAGVEARGGLPAHPDALRALAEFDLGLDPAWRSRRLSDDDLARADLVLTATREHRSALARRVPAAARRTFTLRQFARLVAAAEGVAPGTDGEHPGEVMVQTALRARGLAAPARPADDDLADPIGRPYRAFRETATVVAAASLRISSTVLVAR